ncbi:hypothetical protein D9M72_288000 [compost metagenome]
MDDIDGAVAHGGCQPRQGVDPMAAMDSQIALGQAPVKRIGLPDQASHHMRQQQVAEVVAIESAKQDRGEAGS